MTLLDTSFIYAFFKVTDIHHKEAVKIAKNPLFGKPIILISVLEELITLNTRKGGSPETINLINKIISRKDDIIFLENKPETFQKTWNTFQKHSPHNFSYVDCLLITLSKELRCPVLTFDLKLNKILGTL